MGTIYTSLAGFAVLLVLDALIGCGAGPTFTGCDFPEEDGLAIVDEFYDKFELGFGDPEGTVADAFRNLRVECVEAPRCDYVMGETEAEFGITCNPEHIQQVNEGTGARKSALAHELMHAALWARFGEEHMGHPWTVPQSALVFELYGHPGWNGTTWDY